MNALTASICKHNKNPVQLQVRSFVCRYMWNRKGVRLSCINSASIMAAYI